VVRGEPGDEAVKTALAAETSGAREVGGNKENVEATPTARRSFARTRCVCFGVGSRTMQKLLLVSILLANVAIPIWAARERNARRGLRKALVAMVVFDVAYLVGLLFVYPRL
jgi:hypothetical protein